jgi:hypothetical protein
MRWFIRWFNCDDWHDEQRERRELEAKFYDLQARHARREYANLRANANRRAWADYDATKEFWAVMYNPNDAG